MSAFDLFNEFRPLVRLLDQPLATARGNSHSRFGQFTGPAVEFAEEEGKYIVEAELPGVRKEDLKVTVGEGGRALTIAGSRVQRTVGPRETTNQDTNANTSAGTTGRDVTTTAKSKEQQVSASASRAAGSSSFNFSRTVYLPERVDGADVKAKLEHGILTVEIPKATETPVTEVTVL